MTIHQPTPEVRSAPPPRPIASTPWQPARDVVSLVYSELREVLPRAPWGKWR
jgi:hypothetical protein